MKKKKTLSIILTLLLVISMLSGCFGGSYIDPDVKGDQLSKELLGYLENDDAEGLESMFCNITKSSSNFDAQIQKAMDFFEGKITTYDSLNILSPSSKSGREGKIVFLAVDPDIEGIKTDTGKTYEIKFYDQLVNAEDKNKLGISQMVITSGDGEECTVGEFID